MQLRNLSLLCIFSFLWMTTTLMAQNKGTSPDYAPFQHMTVATGLSTLGGNLEITTPLSSHFSLNAGISIYKYTTRRRQFNLSDPYGVLHKTFGQNVAYSTRAEITNFHGNLVVDYYPVKDGLFYISGGVYFGKTKLLARGTIVNRDGSPAQLQPPFTWPELIFNGQKLDVINGRLDADLTLGNTIKPYLGVGLGRTIPQKRFGVKLELGVMYAGDYTITQENSKGGNVLLRENNFEKVNSEIDWFKYYPMAKLQVLYRLF